LDKQYGYFFREKRKRKRWPFAEAEHFCEAMWLFCMKNGNSGKKDKAGQLSGLSY
jgi:hypothetical protein